MGFSKWIKYVNHTRAPCIVIIDGDNVPTLAAQVTCPSLIVTRLNSNYAFGNHAGHVVVQARTDCTQAADMTAAFLAGKLTHTLKYVPRVALLSKDKSFDAIAAQLKAYGVPCQRVETVTDIEKLATRVRRGKPTK